MTDTPLLDEKLKLRHKVLGMIADKQRYAGAMLDGRELQVIAEALLDRAIEDAASLPPKREHHRRGEQIGEWMGRPTTAEAKIAALAAALAAERDALKGALGAIAGTAPWPNNDEGYVDLARRVLHDWRM